MRRASEDGAATLALALVGLLGAGCQETGISNARPQIEVDPPSLSFGEVAMGSYLSETVTVRNTGTGWLEFDDVEIVNDDDRAFVVSAEPAAILSGEEWSLNVAYVPYDEITSQADLRLTTNAADDPVVDVALEGVGTRPVLDIDPTVLHFDTAEGATTETQVVILESTGSGAVLIQQLQVQADDGGAFDVDVPPSVALPYSLEPGHSIEVEVVHEPVEGETYTAELHVFSNDIHDEDQTVYLMAEPSGAGGSTPEVEITAPPSGYALEEGGVFDLEGVVSDADQDPETLVVYAQSSIDGNLGALAPAADGTVTLADVELSLGDHVVSLYAIDDQGNVGSAVIDVLIWEAGQTFEYVISGGDTPYHYFNVDDDISIMVNGTTVFFDNDGNQNLHAPVTIEAAVGDTIQIVAVDQVACTALLDALFLHLNEANIQQLNDDYAISACEDHEAYDPEYDGPWPNEFFNESYVIAIP